MTIQELQEAAETASKHLYCHDKAYSQEDFTQMIILEALKDPRLDTPSKVRVWGKRRVISIIKYCIQSPRRGANFGTKILHEDMALDSPDLDLRLDLNSLLTKAKLAPKELQCLELGSFGYTQKEIGFKLGLKPRTIQWLKSKALKTLRSVA